MDNNGSKNITFDDYIKNPMSRDNAVFSHRDMYATLYKNKLDTIMVRENGKANYFLYIDKKSGNYFVHIKVPSEVVPDFYYDVVIKFSPTNAVTSMTRTIKDYNVKFYSNDPSFVFTFAHAFLENGLFIEELKSKMSKEAIKTVAKEKNPSNQVGYVKSLYFAYLIMKDRSLFDKIKFDSEANPLDIRRLLSSIEEADIKIAKRQDKGNELSKKNRTEKKKDQNDPNRNSSINQHSRDTKDKLGLSINSIPRASSGNKNNMKKTNSIGKRDNGKNNISKIKKF
jgi:hypothetical protein